MQMSTDDGINYRRRKKKNADDDNLEEEDDAAREEKRLQRERECIGGGFKNSDWLAAIDNNGEVLVLHTSESVQVIPKVYSSREGIDDIPNDDFYERQVVSELHVYSGPKFITHTKLHIGHLCPDEILDLELDNVNDGG